MALLSVAGSLPFGIAMAWLLARRSFPGKSLVDGLVHVPLVVPPVVVGYGLLVLFGVVVGVATVQLLGPLRSLAVGGALGSPLERLTLSLGAGLYEELLFRVVIVALIANGLRLIGFSRLTASAVAVCVGALLFAAFHYVGAFGDPLRLDSFVFRALAGVASLMTMGGTHNRAEKLPNVILASMLAVLVAQPAGRMVQRYLTTSPDLSDTEIVGVKMSTGGGARFHKVQTSRGG